MPAVKKPCPINRNQFRAGAKSIKVTIDGTDYIAEPKEFSTGSLGYYVNGKQNVTINGVRCQAQVGINLTLTGSKEIPA